MDWFIYSVFLLKLSPSHYKSYLPLNIYSYSAMARCTVPSFTLRHQVQVGGQYLASEYSDR